MAAVFVPRSVRRKEPQPNRPGFMKKKKINSSNVLSSNVEIRDERAPMHSHIQREILNSSLMLANNTECCEESDGDEEVVSHSKNQRWPTSGEPVCVMCGRYGAYIVDQTDQDVCSLECKAKHLKDVAKKSKNGETSSNRDTISSDLNFVDESCSQDSIMAKAIITTTTKSYLHCTSSSQTECISQSEKFIFHYTKHPAVAGLSSSKLESIRMNLNIEVKGERVERPILEFEHCQFGKTLSSNLKNCGYITPTPVQMQVIPVGLSMRDVLACAQTGSGKTAAFLLPMIHIIYLETDYLIKSRRSLHLQHPLGIIMAPTRELCIQIEKQAKELMLGLSNMKTALLVGGLPLPPQLHRLRTGVQIIVATPGRMLEVLAQSAVDLSFVRISVLDEVDTMLQMGFEHQVREVLEKLPQEKQTMMFSATIPPSIESMATKLLVNPVYISVGSPSLPNTAVKQIVLWVEDKSKKRRLFSILQDSKHFKPPIVVFVDSKMGADLLAEAVQKVCNLSCLSMHGDKSQSERSSTLESFLAGDCPVIVCTALLGRGIDLPNVSQVINFDMPSSIEEYVHQVGRAGRLGKSGVALTFVNNTNKSVFLSLVETLQPLGVSLPQELLNSPFLHQQVQRAKDSGRKRKRRDQLVTEENLMDLLKRSAMRRKR